MAQTSQIEDSAVFEDPNDQPAQRCRSAKKRLILIVGRKGVRLLDIVAFLDAFEEANRIARAGPEYEVRVVSSGLDRNLISQAGFSLQAAETFRDSCAVADTLLLADAGDCGNAPVRRAFLEWLQWQVGQNRRTGSVSNGTILLADAGLLEGKRVTTHRQFQDALTRRHPRVLLERDVLYVRDGNLYTCAGATAGLDLALHMIQEDLGISLASEVAQSLLLSCRRSGGSAQVSAALRAQAAGGSLVADLLTWLPENLQEDLSVKSLARRAAMSSRNFARIFHREVGVTPARHIESLRLEAARFRLESSDLTVEGVAYATGFENGETLRRLFVRRLGVTPGRYRAMKGLRRAAAA